MSKKNWETDDCNCLENGDLGLGLGLKPGSLPLLNVPDIKGRKKSKEHRRTYPDVGNAPLLPPSQSKFSTLTKLKQQSKILGDENESKVPRFLPSEKMINLENSSGSVDSIGSRQHTISEKIDREKAEGETGLSKEDIERKLLEAEQEVDELKAELEVYQKRLDSKYRAIAILKKQVADIESDYDEQEKMKREYEESLEHEVNTLNFELEKRESTYENSQEIWASRFDSMCKENACLTSLLEKRTEETRNLMSRTSALSRERDELLALLDVQERSKYLKSHTVSSEEAYGDYTSSELAVLGACKCRHTSPEPCGCAHAAANMRREIVRLKHECDVVKKRKEEAYHTVEAYRSAFEEQLTRNKQLTMQMAEVAVAGPTRIQKAKTVLKNLIHLLNDDDYLIEGNKEIPSAPNGVQSKSQTDEESVHVMSDRELVLALTQILHVRNEAFAHQKIAAQVLSQRVQDLESQLANFQPEEVFRS